jgi:hypothetical protein
MRQLEQSKNRLARMARFIIADLTDPSSIPKELEAIVPELAVPVQPLLEGAALKFRPSGPHHPPNRPFPSEVPHEARAVRQAR